MPPKTAYLLSRIQDGLTAKAVYSILAELLNEDSSCEFSSKWLYESDLIDFTIRYSGFPVAKFQVSR
jgi:hypothetical protein